MTALGVFQILVFFLLILAVTKPLGSYMTRVFAGERTFLHPVLRPLERLCYAIGGVKESVEQRWTKYAGSLLAFSLFSFLILYLLQRLQGLLPLNPMGFSTLRAPTSATPMTPDLAFNTAVSFATNTNWQNYGGETTLSYLVQMAGLTVHNFTSAAAGIAIAVALIRGFARQQANAIGNFWVDLVRATVYIFATAFARDSPVLLFAGRYPEPEPVHVCHDARRENPDDRPGSCRLAGSHQDAGNQRRWLLQRQFSASI